MSSPTPLLEDSYALFKSHLLFEVLGLPGDSPPVKALIEGVGIDLLTDFLLQPPSCYGGELTYVEELEDGTTVLMAPHPTYVHLLTAFYWWCHLYIEGNSVTTYSVWIWTTQVDFL